MINKELKEILENHLHWIRADREGWENMIANLRGANLRGANLGGANLSEVKTSSNTSFFAMQCPESGAFVGYKKASGKIVKLLIPEDAKRSSATSRKCRCSKAFVVQILDVCGTESDKTSVPSDYDDKFIYAVGQNVEVNDFDNDRWNECSTGIHFFITFDEAKNY